MPMPNQCQMIVRRTPTRDVIGPLLPPGTSSVDEVAEAGAKVVADHAEGGLGAGGEDERRRVGGQVRVCDTVQGGADQRSGGTERGGEGDPADGTSVEHDVAASIEPTQRHLKVAPYALQNAPRVGEQLPHPVDRRGVAAGAPRPDQRKPAATFQLGGDDRSTLPVGRAGGEFAGKRVARHLAHPVGQGGEFGTGP